MERVTEKNIITLVNKTWHERGFTVEENPSMFTTIDNSGIIEAWVHEVGRGYFAADKKKLGELYIKKTKQRIEQLKENNYEIKTIFISGDNSVQIYAFQKREENEQWK